MSKTESPWFKLATLIFKIFLNFEYELLDRALSSRQYSVLK